MAEIKQGAPPARSVAKQPPIPQAVQQAVCPLGHHVSEGVLYCTECGVRMGESPEPWSCRQGHSNEARCRYCGQCGQARPEPSAPSMVQALINPPRYQRPDGQDGAVLIHFVEDGFNFAGQIWYRNQELAVMPGTARYAEALAWINLDAAAQQRRFGKVYFAPGHAPQGRVTAVQGVRQVPGA